MHPSSMIFTLTENVPLQNINIEYIAVIVTNLEENLVFRLNISNFIDAQN